MTGIRKIELRAQIRILTYLMDHLCNGELPEAGRKAIRNLIFNLTEQAK
jgi:hypothetical protein